MTPSHIVASSDPHAVLEWFPFSSAPADADTSRQLKLCPVVRVREQRSSEGEADRSSHGDEGFMEERADAERRWWRRDDFVGFVWDLRGESAFLVCFFMAFGAGEAAGEALNEAAEFGCGEAILSR